MIWTIPNLLTLLRVVCIPIMVAAFYLPGPWSGQIAAVVFVIAAVTDWFDGWLARRLQDLVWHWLFAPHSRMVVRAVYWSDSLTGLGCGSMPSR